MKELTAGHYIDYLRLNRILEALEKWLYSAEIIALVAQEFPASYHFVLTSATYWTLRELQRLMKSVEFV